MLFIDCSSAFNTIVPSKRITNLRTLGLNTSLCNWTSWRVFCAWWSMIIHKSLSSPNKCSVRFVHGFSPLSGKEDMLYSSHTCICPSCGHWDSSLLGHSRGKWVTGRVYHRHHSAASCHKWSRLPKILLFSFGPWLFLTKPSFVLAFYKGKSLIVRHVQVPSILS